MVLRCTWRSRRPLECNTYWLPFLLSVRNKLNVTTTPAALLATHTAKKLFVATGTRRFAIIRKAYILTASSSAHQFPIFIAYSPKVFSKLCLCPVSWLNFLHFQARSQNCEKRLLASSYQSVCLSVGLSVRIEQLNSHWTNFDETWYFSFFENLSTKLKFH